MTDDELPNEVKDVFNSDIDLEIKKLKKDKKKITKKIKNLGNLKKDINDE